jgi:hypothetical protein
MTVDAIDRLLRQANPIPDPMQVEPVDGSYLFEAEASDATLVDIALEPEPGPRAKRRRRLIAAAAAVVLAIAASALVVASRHDTARTEVPVGPGPTPTTAPSPPTVNVGFLPPEGATPSTPTAGELVAAWYVHPTVGSSFPGSRQVYADGRVLSYQVSRDSGLLEQRLTPEGVELVRSEIVSNGLFGDDVDLSRGARGIIRVRNGGRLVLVRVGDRMLLRLAALETWLPPRVWEDREATAYIPSTYAVCVGRASSWEALPDPVQAVSLFPAPLPQLSGSPRRADDYPMGLPSGLVCWNVTTEQVREVAAAFDAAGIETEYEIRWGLYYRFDVPEPVSTAVDVVVWPVLPEGALGGIGGA